MGIIILTAKTSCEAYVRHLLYSTDDSDSDNERVENQAAVERMSLVVIVGLDLSPAMEVKLQAEIRDAVAGFGGHFADLSVWWSDGVG